MVLRIQNGGHAHREQNGDEPGAHGREQVQEGGGRVELAVGDEVRIRFVPLARAQRGDAVRVDRERGHAPEQREQHHAGEEHGLVDGLAHGAAQLVDGDHGAG